ncbi:MAG: helix-turn-helix domain-containing protein [Microbacterium sp.]|uniref:TetR/AcrR family transcriptional regulator n=1 Tax=Microbacterium sp. TaxID=51671 RepID=UPI0039E610EE
MSTRSEQATRTRQTILETARRLFFSRGYSATSLQDIADEMGVVKANVYYYFRTKDSIITELLAERIAELDVLIGEVEGIADREEREHRLIQGYVEQVVIAHRSLAPVNFTDPAIRDLPEVTERLDALTARAAIALFGAAPTPRQRASLAIALDLKPALRELTALSDSEVRAGLTAVCRALLAAAWPEGVATPAGPQAWPRPARRP